MKRTLRSTIRALTFVLLWGIAMTARHAQAAELRIDWNAPPECTSARELSARVMQLIGGPVPSNLQAVVEVTRGEQAYRALVIMRGPTGFGERRLEDTRCDALLDQVAVLMALSIPTRSNLGSGDELSLAMGLEGRLTWGPLPLLAAGGGGSIALDGLGPFYLALHGAYYFPQSSTFDRSSLGAHFQLFSVGVCVCRLWRLGRLQSGPCIGAGIYHMRATGFGGATELPGSTTWWGPSLRLLGRVQLLAAFSMDISVEGTVPLVRPQFVFSDVGELHRVSAVALQVSVGPEVRF